MVKVSPIQLDVFLFGDQLNGIHEAIQALYQLSDESILTQRLLDSCIESVCHEAAKVSSSTKQLFSYRDFHEMSEAHEALSSPHPAMVSVLATVAGLGCLLRFAEQSSESCWKSSKPIAMGIGMGALPAAAFAASSHTLEFLTIAPLTTALAFRLGSFLSERVGEQDDLSLHQWLAWLPNCSIDSVIERLDLFHSSNYIPEHRKIEICVKSADCLAICGSHALLEDYLSTNSPDTDIHGCIAHSVHATPYYCQTLSLKDIEDLIGDLASDLKTHKAISAMISTSSGGTIYHENLLEASRKILLDVLSPPLDLSACASQVKAITGSKNSRLAKIGQCSITGTGRLDLFSGAWVVDLDRRYQQIPASAVESIAIIGMSGRFPEADDLEKFWSLLEQGTDTHQEAPSDRLDSRCDQNWNEETTTGRHPFGCFLRHPGLFDRSLFRMSPREACQTDPIHRMLLMTAYEALEMAGYSSAHSKEVATFFGQSSDDWREVNASQNVSVFYVPGGIRAFGPGRINYHFGWEAQSVSLDAACSSSAFSVQMACSALRSGQCSMALAGGANLMTSLEMYQGLARGSFLSPTGPCKTFDSGADGYCRADGVGTIVLKKLKDAIEDGDIIQAIIRGSGTNHSGKAISITHPHAETQERLFRQVLREARLRPEQIDYIEMHGTGTIAGDSMESSSVNSVFGSTSRRVHVGAVKANLGHGEAASGVTSIIKVLMMMRKNVIPKHIGIKESMSQDLAFNTSHSISIPEENLPFLPLTGGDGRRRVMINNFNATGGNTSLILEDFPTKKGSQGSRDPRNSHVVTISGATLQSLQRNIQRLLQYLSGNTNVDIADIAYTTTARRLHHGYRVALVASSVSDLERLLENREAKLAQIEKIKEPPAVIFAFSGQASQYLGMGSVLFQTSKVFHKKMREMDQIAQRLGLPSFLNLIIGHSEDDGSCDPISSQLSLVAMEVATASLWSSWGLKPSVVIGHSLGEYAALHFTGVLTLSDMLYLVGERAKIMKQRLTPDEFSMMALHISGKQAHGELQLLSYPRCEVSCFNGPNLSVISGPQDDLKSLASEFEALGVRTRHLETPFGFHSAQMDDIAAEVNHLAKSVHVSKPKIQIVSTCSNFMFKSCEGFDNSYFSQQMRNAVDFEDAVSHLKDTLQGGEPRLANALWVEVGPGSSCLTMARDCLGTSKDKCLETFSRNSTDWRTISTSLAKAYQAGADVLWDEVHHEFLEHVKLLELPSYAFDLKQYWTKRVDNNSSNPGHQPVSDSQRPQRQYLSTTVHRLEKRERNGNCIIGSYTTDLADPELQRIVRGHVVNDVALCPSSLYYDMALVAASLVFSGPTSGELSSEFEVAEMEVLKPLIPSTSCRSQLIRMTTETADDDDITKISIASAEPGDDTLYARCIARKGSFREWRNVWRNTTYLYHSRVEHLQEKARMGKTDTLGQKLTYRLFSSFVKFAEKFQSMQEVILDAPCLEATAKVKLPLPESDRRFACDPHWFEGLAHLSGFILNGGGDMPNGLVYISSGWKSARIAVALDANKCYRSYVRMQPGGGQRNVLEGDVVLFDGAEIIGLIAGVRFQGLKRSVVCALLGASSNDALQTTHHNSSLPKNDGRNPSSAKNTLEHLDALVASELGLLTHELRDELSLDDFGWNSIAAISLQNQLRNIFEIEVPVSLLLSGPTLGQLRKILQGEANFSVSTMKRASRSLTQCDTFVQSDQVDSLRSIGTGNQGLSTAFVQILVEELGVELSEILPSTTLSDLGIDSLLSLSIASSFTERTGVAIASAALLKCSTISDFMNHLSGGSQVPASRTESSCNKTRSTPTPSISCTFARLQQGNILEGPTLFLFPDGSGSAGSYAWLESLHVSAGMNVIALNSPYLDNPGDFTVSLENIVAEFVNSILAIQCGGPCILGGWSLGGVYAFEAAKQLLAEGKEAHGLILIDSIAPYALQPLPVGTLSLLEANGIFDKFTKHQPDTGLSHQRLLQHFEASICAMQGYSPEPLRASSLGKCHVIWARHGAFESRISKSTEGQSFFGDFNTQDLNETQEWLLCRKSNFGPQGWDRMLPAHVKVRCHVVDGDHFSIMTKPDVLGLCVAIDAALKDILSN